MESALNENKHDKYSKERRQEYGECPKCNRYNTNCAWCQSCDPELLTKGWTSGNETLDELIKSTQLKARAYHNADHLQWIPYGELEIIKEIGRGGFATVYKAT